MSIGLWDADLTSIGQVPFNLELMKISAYYKKQREIVAMSPRLEPSRYSKFFIRKDWDDGDYPTEFFSPNCSHGGRAFNPIEYKPLPPEIENSEPDVYIYDTLKDRFDKQFYSIQINGTHLRLTNGFKDVQISKSLIAHDYNINDIPGSYEYIKQMLSTQKRLYLQTKFPIGVSNVADLQKWNELNIGSLTTVKFCGIMNKETMEYLMSCPKNRMASFVYDVTDGYVGQQDFVQNRLPIIFHQISILRKFNPKKLLIFDSSLFENQELALILNIFNEYAAPLYVNYSDNLSIKQRKLEDTLASFLKSRFYSKYKPNCSVEQARAAFQFVREQNYPLFQEFYQNNWRDFL